MTLAIALRTINGLVLGADSRVTSVGLINDMPTPITRDVSEKFLQVNRDVGVLTYGLADPGYGGISRLVATAKQNPSGAFTTYSGISRNAASVFKEEYESWRLKQTSPILAPVGFILAGYDSVESNKFRVTSYQSPDFTANESVPPAFLAGQWHVSQYLIQRLYSPELTVETVVDMAVFLFLETMCVEETVGGPIQLATVTLERGFQRLHEDDIQQVIRRLQRKIGRSNRQLLEFFAP